METRQHRMTRQRKVILDTLRRLKTHPTADEVFSIVRKQLPRISLGTVYRNLELLFNELSNLNRLFWKCERIDNDCPIWPDDCAGIYLRIYITLKGVDVFCYSFPLQH